MFCGRKFYLMFKMIGLYIIIGVLLYILGHFIFTLPSDIWKPDTIISKEKVYLILGIITLIVISMIYFSSRIRFLHDEFLDYLDIEFIQDIIKLKNISETPTLNTIDEMWKQINRRAEKNKIQTMSSKIMDKLSELKEIIGKK